MATFRSAGPRASLPARQRGCTQARPAPATTAEVGSLRLPTSVAHPATPAHDTPLESPERRDTRKKRAIITGITGQDGSYLAELLLGKGYEVHGLIRRASTFNTDRIDHIYQDSARSAHQSLFLHYADLTDGSRLVTLLSEIQPDEVYNLAAQSHVRVSFDEPEYTGDVTGPRHDPPARGDPRDRPEDPLLSGEQFRDVRSDAAAPERGDAVLPAVAVRGREGLLVLDHAATIARPTGIFASNGILFNHESPRRGDTFVTRKITRAVARIKAGRAAGAVHGQSRRRARLGLRARVRRGDVAHASSTTSRPTSSSRPTPRTPCSDFLQFSFEHAGLDWQKYVKFDERYLRPTEVDSLIGDPAKANRRARLDSARC